MWPHPNEVGWEMESLTGSSFLRKNSALWRGAHIFGEQLLVCDTTFCMLF